MFTFITSKIKYKIRVIKWRKKNSHNETTPIGDFNDDLVSIGKYTYGAINVLNFSSDKKLKIGNFCSIASNTMFIVCADHSLKSISTYPFKVKCLKTETYEALSKGDIIVDDDVWIGQNAIILSGVHIGQGAIVAAGAVVAHDVAPYSIVAGIPAREIKKRFDDEIINEMIKIDYSKLDKDTIEKNINNLYKDITNINQLAWLPKKDTLNNDEK